MAIHSRTCAASCSPSGITSSPTETLHVIKEDPADDRILDCAVAAKSDFIVSEDKDLLRLRQFGNARIVSVRDFINLALTPGTTR
jgi:predicted nucleic acid-binding protein